MNFPLTRLFWKLPCFVTDVFSALDFYHSPCSLVTRCLQSLGFVPALTPKENASLYPFCIIKKMAPEPNPVRLSKGLWSWRNCISECNAWGRLLEKEYWIIYITTHRDQANTRQALKRASVNKEFCLATPWNRFNVRRNVTCQRHINLMSFIKPYKRLPTIEQFRLSSAADRDGQACSPHLLGPH